MEYYRCIEYRKSEMVTCTTPSLRQKSGSNCVAYFRRTNGERLRLCCDRSVIYVVPGNIDEGVEENTSRLPPIIRRLVLFVQAASRLLVRDSNLARFAALLCELLCDWVFSTDSAGLMRSIANWADVDEVHSVSMNGSVFEFLARHKGTNSESVTSLNKASR
jgi:hypothetical protein